ncbi:alpha/beta fold hydrolase [Nesterenkonia cremea]|uniref:AB hydrolase-1 domain-containing protein n=1 Tax=Nesterenkonia cremea TaxID=1882340 RepID=A0A917AQE8_9MICC|nr:alpha/beta fold hydrolase [Nesterenkonia cremea]GGE66324.1 hypothetical protein GCM10011401_12010 [Nesterenkonia cremea]
MTSAPADRLSLAGSWLTSPEDAPAEKPLLIVGPSLGTSVEALWRPAVSFLEKRFHVVGWDLPGHGAGTPEAEAFSITDLAQGVRRLTAAVRQEAGLTGPAYYAGVSIGGAVAQQLAVDAEAEPTFEKVVVLCSAAKIGEPVAWRERAEFVEQAGTPSMVEGSAKRWFAPGFIEAQPAITAGLLHSLQNSDRHSYARCCEALGEFDLREKLRGAAVPVLAVAGAEDAVCPPEQAELIAQTVPQGRHAVLADVGHLAPAEAPEQTAELIKEFIA